MTDILIKGVFDDGEFVVTPETKDEKALRNKNSKTRDLLSLPPARNTSTKPILKNNSQLVGATDPVCQPCRSAPALDDGGDIRELLGVSPEDSSARCVMYFCPTPLELLLFLL